MYDNPSTTSISYEESNITRSTPNTSGEKTTTYKLDTVHFGVFLEREVIDDVTLIHPFGDQAKPVFMQRSTQQREDIWVAKMLPGYSLSAEPLHTHDRHG